MPAEQSWYTGHFWSLAVEEHYYLLWPVLLWTFGLRRGWKVAAALAVAIALWRGLDEHFNWIAAAHPMLRGEPGRTDYRLDGLLWGCVAAFVWAEPRARGLVAKAGGTGAVLLVTAAIVACLIWTPPAYVAVIAILMALLPLATVGNPTSLASRILDTAALAWVGRLSYSLYLWQQLFLPHPTVRMSIPLVQTLPFNLAFAFLAAWLSYRYVELPALAMGKTIQNRRRIVRTAAAHA
jgi:peptidoglycan/LPS O-acetylase OafA/YrhL